MSEKSNVNLEISADLFGKLVKAKVYAAPPPSETSEEGKSAAVVTLGEDQKKQFENGLALGNYLRVLKTAMVSFYE